MAYHTAPLEKAMGNVVTHPQPHPTPKFCIIITECYVLPDCIASAINPKYCSRPWYHKLISFLSIAVARSSAFTLERQKRQSLSLLQLYSLQLKVTERRLPSNQDIVTK